ncbi:MAG: bifunctional 4-hydroxy-2-oxoglutarate aldolase/2-dehydro-3-deoxy-phosphogluconate aldolase [Cyanobacteria bacterium Co-bin13]|nr:bifunctional 4-hydroxy-2-oxoglutarate aldolase/2-dehydro-3-deoxy-phosphogluconate aldolase [Cyanobacteria bacterium Co-bin13]
MDREDWLTLLQKHRLLAVIRAPDLAAGLAMARVAEQGGVRLIEITWDSEQPEELVGCLRQDLPHCWIGAGTLLTLAAAERAIAAGAQFGFSPFTDVSLLELGLKRAVPMVAGALTPTEIVTAWRAGAAGVKVFPVSAVGGATYIRSLRGPLPAIPLIPTGGVTSDNAKALLEAGAIAVGLSGSLFPPAQVQKRDWAGIAQRIEQLQQQLGLSYPA